jgi:hypothetical protein
VGDLAAPEHDGDARLVPLLEEPADVLHLELVVVLLRLGTELHFLELHDHLLLLRLGRLLLRLVLELAVVHQLADRRLGHRGDLHEIHPLGLRPLQRDLGGQDTELLAGGPDHADFACANTTIGACVPNGDNPP